MDLSFMYTNERTGEEYRTARFHLGRVTTGGRDDALLPRSRALPLPLRSTHRLCMQGLPEGPIGSSRER